MDLSSGVGELGTKDSGPMDRDKGLGTKDSVLTIRKQGHGTKGSGTRTRVFHLSLSWRLIFNWLSWLHIALLDFSFVSCAFLLFSLYLIFTNTYMLYICIKKWISICCVIECRWFYMACNATLPGMQRHKSQKGSPWDLIQPITYCKCGQESNGRDTSHEKTRSFLHNGIHIHLGNTIAPCQANLSTWLHGIPTERNRWKRHHINSKSVSNAATVTRWLPSGLGPDSGLGPEQVIELRWKGLKKRNQNSGDPPINDLPLVFGRQLNKKNTL